MTKKLFIQAITKFLLGIVLLGVLLFVPAGTMRFRNAWILFAVLFIPMFAAGVIMMLKDPELLKKRLNAKESEGEQKAVIALSGLMFIGSFVAAGLNHRFGWFTMPNWIIWAAVVVFLLAYLMFGEVLRENSYLSRTIEVQEGQKVVDTGLYGIVRHPMYMATVLLFLMMPLVLGSVLSFLILLSYIPLIVKRIRNEEQVLEEGLAGYREYKEKVRYRLIPHIW